MYPTLVMRQSQTKHLFCTLPSLTVSLCTPLLLLEWYLFNIFFSTSPSVYVAYQSLEAFTGNCGPFPNVVQGQKNTTIGYPPGSLSTYVTNLFDWASMGSEGFPPASAVNYTQLQYVTSTEGLYLSLPDDLVSLDPAYNNCGNFTVAVGDPPRTLGPATAMVPSVTAAAPALAASPGAQVEPALASSTPKPAPKDSNFKVSLAITPADSQESSSQDSDPQNADPKSPSDPPPNKPNTAADPDSLTDPSIPTKDGEGSEVVKSGDKSVAEQSDHNNAGIHPAGAEIQYGSDPTSSEKEVTGNYDDPPVVSINGQQIQAAHGGGVVIGTSTVRPGGQMTQDGTTLSVGTSSMMIDGTAYALPTNSVTPPLIINGQTIAKDSNGGVVIGTSTYPPGTNTQISGMAFSVGINNVVINGATYTLPTHPEPSSPAGHSSGIVIGGESVNRAADGGVWIGSSSIAAGSQATISNHVISVASSSVVVDGTSFPLPSAPLPTTNAFLVGGESINRAADGGVWIGSSSIALGAQATISGHVVSVASASVVVDGTAIPLAGTPAAIDPTVLIDGQSISRAADGGVWFDESVSIGLGAQATISGHVISVAFSSVVVDGTAYPLAAATPLPLLVDGESIIRAANGGVFIGSSSLPLGALATIAGDVISVGASSVMVDGTFYPLPTAAGAILQKTKPEPQGGDDDDETGLRSFTLANGAVITIPAHAGAGASAGGGVATTVISGTSYSYSMNEKSGFVVVDGKTESLLLPPYPPSPTATATMNSIPVITGTSDTGSGGGAIGGFIMSGFGNGSSGAGMEFTGAARRSRSCVGVLMVVEVAVVLVMVVVGGGSVNVAGIGL